ncbi:hypothetical protein FPY71_07350 [Aureimonas fodinaquatilis]|uniref:Uncharacterized protein n=1 Tax=Aureimonas fodinaquatilis TaxID=2565783 RepID=A0A5B0DWF5_9HYPH|nr:hypothetical protein [Aureimonas fodinaquatilis]KAA0970332.1 hypothetical protein FPY71_07350 [Aureimonas fodinaquatilis]
MHRLWYDMMMLGIESQQVMFLRTMKLARGGKAGEREAQRMVAEKLSAAGAAGMTLSHGGTAETVVKGYRKKVRANARRLSRPS